MLNLKTEEEVGIKKREADFSQLYLVWKEAQTEIHEIPFKCKKKLATTCHKFPREVQNLIRHGPGQPAVVVLALRRSLGLYDLQRSLTNSAILWFSVLGNSFETQSVINLNFLLYVCHYFVSLFFSCDKWEQQNTCAWCQMKWILGIQNGFLVTQNLQVEEQSKSHSAEHCFWCNESLHDSKYFTVFIAVRL